MQDNRSQLRRLALRRWLLGCKRMQVGGIGNLFMGCLILVAWGCKPDGPQASEKYPDYIAKIMRRNCSIKGCHTDASAAAAGGLNLETWAGLFEGARGGSPVIPYAPDQSYLLYAINTDTTNGPTLSPTMPIGKPALSQAEYLDLRQWILDGARNDRGDERFPPKADRRKWYVGNAGCDLVGVIDAESKQIMRYVEVGNRSNSLEQPHEIVVSPDQQSWYVLFVAGSSHVDQYSSLTDTKTREISLGYNGWNGMATTNDGHYGFVSGEYIYEVATVDLVQGTVVGQHIPMPGNVHGPTVHPQNSRLYLAADYLSAVYTLDFDQSGNLSNLQTIDLVQGQQPAIAGELWPYELFFLPDGSKYYVLCYHSREVRVLDGATDALLAVIPVNAGPTNISYAPATGRLFVTCMEDSTVDTGNNTRRGSVAVIDVQTDQVIQSVYPGFQPYGVVVDEASGYAVVVNRNLRQDGPTGHHVSTCVGRNGYVTLLDLQSLQMVEDYKMECTVDPLVIALKR